MLTMNHKKAVYLTDNLPKNPFHTNIEFVPDSLVESMKNVKVNAN